jgi:Na+/melibiose symporter-like transporter
MVIGYITIFAYGMLNAFGYVPLNIWLLSGVGVLVFAAQGLFYMVLLVMVTNTIEYNQWTTGERKESVIFAARPFAAKMSSSLQTLLVFVILLIGGIYNISEQISNLEVIKDIENLTTQEVLDRASQLISEAQNLPVILTWLLIGMTIIPLILFIISYILIRKKFFITEKAYARMLDDINSGEVGTHNLEELKQIA